MNADETSGATRGSTVDIDHIDQVFHLSPFGAMATDTATRIVYVNPAFECVTGYMTEETVGCTPAILHSGRHGREFYDSMWRSLQIQGWWQGEIWNRHKNGDIYPEWLTINRICNNPEGRIAYLGQFSDISQRKEQDAILNYESTHDSLTGLCNHLQMQRYLHGRLLQARAQQRSVAVLYIDLDRFKLVNDCCGHEQGNLLLQIVSEKLRACVREADFVARVGGDEFVVVLDVLRSSENVAFDVAQKILTALAETIQLDSLVAKVGCSIGISIFPDNGDSVSELLKTADMAMYKAKRQGGGCIFRFG